MKDGLSQQDRLQRMIPADSFEALDGRMETLLRQAKEISAFIRYYNPEMQADGYFDTFLSEIKQLRPHLSSPAFDGNMEPSQAVLYTFLCNLHGIIQEFNKKWKEQYIPWYINQILGIQSEPLKPDFTWICFQPGVKETIYIPKGQRLTCADSDANHKIYYCLTEDMEVNAVRIDKAYMLQLEKNDVVYPANLFRFPVALHKKNYFSAGTTSSEANEKLNTIQSPGLQITSPSFLLESGTRKVKIAFQSEKQEPISFFQKRKIAHLFHEKKEKNPSLTKQEIRENTYINLLSSLFYLKISAGNGWETIPQYTVGFEDKQLNIGFLLEENFPSTTACNPDLHETTTEYPALKILLNNNAWLYPYDWLKNFYIKKITIHTRVESTSNLLLYNDLGLVDMSKPFCPFGINTEKGAWFVLGSYEMAKKRLQSLDVKMQWQQLPDNRNGLYGYYFDYQDNIDNKSFKIRPKYLLDYHWKNTDNSGTVHLFSTAVKEDNGQPETRGKLADESYWQNIRIKDVPPVQVD